MQQAASPVQPVNLPHSIAFVRQQFSHFGGGELMLDRIITALAARGVGVKLIARRWEARPGVAFVPCNPPRFPRGSRDSRFANAACAIVRSGSTTLVQSHERIDCCDIFRAGDGVHAAYLAHRARGMGFAAKLLQKFSAYHRDVLRLERRMFESERLKAVIVNSEMVADEIVAFYGYPQERIHLIPNGIDLDRFNSGKQSELRAATRKRLGVAQDKKVLILVGSGYDRKGLRAAIETLALSGTNAELWVVGRDRRPSHFSKYAARFGIADRLRMLGPQADALPFIQAADAMLLPSIYDPFPSAVLEALATGVPVVTSESCGARDAVRALDAKLVRDAYDTEGLAQAIGHALALAEHPETAARCRAIAAGYGMDAMIDRMLELYSQFGHSRAVQ